MADFCKQCSLDLFDRDFGELAGITTPEDWAEGKAAVVICEGCGPVQVDPEGNCVSEDCLKAHGKKECERCKAEEAALVKNAAGQPEDSLAAGFLKVFRKSKEAIHNLDHVKQEEPTE